MQQYLMLYILIFGVLSSVMWMYINREDLNDNVLPQFTKAVLFFYNSHYFIMSTVKLYLDDPDATLYESFWDIRASTYIHYGIPLLFISILLPLFTKWILRTKSMDLINIFDFCILISLFLEYLIKCHISNIWYCVTYIICVVLAGVINRIYKKDINYITSKEYKKYIIKVLPAIGAWIVTVGIYLPNELYLSNPNEFFGYYSAFLAITIISGLLTGGLIILLGLLFIPKKIYELLNLLLSITILLGYLQNMFLNGKLDNMDGTQQIWSNGTKIVNLIIWLTVIISILLIRAKNINSLKICQWLCCYIILIQVFSLGYLILTSDIDNEENSAVLSNHGALEIAENNNIIVFVLDRFDADWFEDIVDMDESFVEPLADFTFYRNATSKFLHTDRAIPFMLTGTDWDDDVGDYNADFAFENSDVLEKLHQKGYDIDIFTDIIYIPDFVHPIVSNYETEIEYRYKYTDIFKFIINSSMYKISPFILKNMHFYYSGDTQDIITADNVWSINNDRLLYNELIYNNLNIKEGLDNAFKFYHMRGVHGPYYLTEELRLEDAPWGWGKTNYLYSQARGCMKIVYEYIAQLQRLGKYDDATIIITADHGESDIVNSKMTTGSPDMTSRPIFIIKLPYEKNNSMQVNNAPVSQDELTPTYLKAAGIDWKANGRTFEEIPEDEQRERRVVDIYFDRFVKYIINGDSSNVDNWDIIDAEYF